MKSKVYIGGAITGLPKDVVLNKFNQAQAGLEFLGYEVVNPLKIHNIFTLQDYIDHNSKEWHQYMREDLTELLKCDKLFLLPCWVSSKGAILERDVALRIGIEVIYL